MKVGIDSVLLGAWAKVESNNRVLDVGTGTGILALMLAQKNSNTIIDAIDIDKSAYSVAKSNVRASPFASQIRVNNESFQHFVQTNQEKYDLVISNPPYFDEDIKPKEVSRKLARHNESLRLEELVEFAYLALNADGEICFIYPYREEVLLDEIITNAGFFISHKILIKPSRYKNANRVIIRAGKAKLGIQESDFMLRDAHGYSEEFRELTKNYYLNLK